MNIFGRENTNKIFQFHINSYQDFLFYTEQPQNCDPAQAQAVTLL